MYTGRVDVAISELRAHLGDWLARARVGQDVVVTDRGIPVARLVGVDATDTLERLTIEGAITAPMAAARPSARELPRVRSRGSVSDLVTEQRR
jgi:prevent-host-death family protein